MEYEGVSLLVCLMGEECRAAERKKLMGLRVWWYTTIEKEMA
jgi:hypothetical protein